ncbi:hypothetical protein ZHAS_00007353 [Anopheles sinensis]|uniref:Secreted protein n=1 Tax=Anopheles sinensis TaxID=74873 RepID=A0A084VPS4_ANOSI|nr:hypothetical protein ZHAS_00007353 [Anopheles sinensis]
MLLLVIAMMPGLFAGRWETMGACQSHWRSRTRVSNNHPKSYATIRHVAAVPWIEHEQYGRILQTIIEGGKDANGSCLKKGSAFIFLGAPMMMA